MFIFSLNFLQTIIFLSNAHILNFNLLNIIYKNLFKFLCKFYILFFILSIDIILNLIQTTHLFIFIIKYLNDKIIYYYINFIFQF